MTHVVDAVVALSLMIVFGVALATIVVRMHGLRLTDALGYVFCAGSLVAMPLRLWDSGPWLLLGALLAAILGIVGARRTLLAWRRGDAVYGIFTFGPVPDGVIDRVRSWTTSRR